MEGVDATTLELLVKCLGQPEVEEETVWGGVGVDLDANECKSLCNDMQMCIPDLRFAGRSPMTSESGFRWALPRKGLPAPPHTHTPCLAMPGVDPCAALRHQWEPQPPTGASCLVRGV